jgi:lysine 2-monooxygenase
MSADGTRPVTMFGPDFPFAFDDWIAHPAGLGSIPAERHGAKVAIVGAGIAGVICGHELMRMGVHPVLYESGQFGGRLRSQPFEGAEGVIAELGGMRFPVSSTGFYHYVDRLGIESRSRFPIRWSPASSSTVIDLEGETHLCRKARRPAANVPRDRGECLRPRRWKRVRGFSELLPGGDP